MAASLSGRLTNGATVHLYTVRVVCLLLWFSIGAIHLRTFRSGLLAIRLCLHDIRPGTFDVDVHSNGERFVR